MAKVGWWKALRGRRGAAGATARLASAAVMRLRRHVSPPSNTNKLGSIESRSHVKIVGTAPLRRYDIWLLLNSNNY